MRFMHPTTLLWLFLAVAVSATPAKAADLPESVIEALQPGLAAFEKAAARQADQWAKGCTSGKAAALKQAFDATSDAWMALDPVASGPVTLLFRRERLYLWPVRRNAVGRAVAGHLAKPAPLPQDPDDFARLSAALQGLPALEQLLYAHGDKAGTPGWCDLGGKAAASVQRIAAELIEGWADIHAHLDRGEPVPVYFEEAPELTNLLYTDLVVGFTRFRDQRILAMLADDAAKANPGRGEQALSDRTLSDLMLSAQALRAFAEPFLAAMSADLRAEVTAALDDLVAQSRALRGPLDKTLRSDEGRAAFTAAFNAAGVARKLLVTKGAPALGVVLGFNNLDGD
ncbi:MAG: imelysin family protein [Rhodospirillales bacterium]